MDLSTLWGGMVSLIILLLGWNWRAMDKRMDSMETRHSRAISDAIQTYKSAVDNCDMSHTKMQDIVTGIQINYVHKEDMKEMRDDMKSMRKELTDRFDRLEILVRNKQ